jgi:hypothetical protein
MNASESRPVPHHIDRNERLGEYVFMVFACFYGLKNLLGVGYALVVGIAAALIYAKLTAGKPPGYFIQRVLYRQLGVGLGGLLSHRYPRFSR